MQSSALTVAGEQAGFEASFLMGTNALTVSTIPDIVTAGGMTLLATDGAYVLNEINTYVHRTESCCGYGI
ncbi:MAG: hypothetical protein ACLR78_01985 [Roseburia sp.]